MAQYEANLNQTITKTLDKATEDLIYIQIRNQSNQYAQIDHIAYGYSPVGADQDVDFGSGVFEIIQNALIEPARIYCNNGFAPDDTGLDVIYAQVATTLGPQVIDFNRPLIIPAGAPALIILAAPIEKPGAAALGAIIAYLTVIGSYQSNAGLAKIALR